MILTMHSPSHAKTVAGTARRRSRGFLKESIAAKKKQGVGVGERKGEGKGEKGRVKEAGVLSNSF